MYIALALVVLAGFALRVWNVDFDQGIGSHPDERSTACFYATTIHMPSSWQQFLDPHQSPLNPLWDVNQQTRRSFTYGHFPLYLGVAVGESMHRLAPLFERLGAPEPVVSLMARAHEDCSAIAVAGRLTIAFLDTVTILLLFVLGRVLFGPIAGLLAATFYAFSAQAIQLSHFFAMDPASTTFIVLTVIGGVRMLRSRSFGSAVLTGIAAGLAVSSKFSSLPILAVPVTAGVLAMVCEGQRARRDGSQPDGRLQFRATYGVLIAFLFAGLAFLVTSPYAVLDWQSFIQATLVEQGRMVRGIADMPFTRQYRNTLPYVYFLVQQVEWGLWWPLGLVALAGTATMFVAMIQTLLRLMRNWLLISRQKYSEILVPPPYQTGLLVAWSWVAPYFIITGAFLAKFNRYMSPLLPFAALFAAGTIWLLWRVNPRALSSSTSVQPQGAGEVSGEIDEENPDPVWGDSIEGTDDGDSVPVSAGDAEFHSGGIPWISIRRGLAIALAVVGVGGGLFWSAAYVNGVYRGEHTWITASRWIYENVPAGSTILWELWDDPLPKSIPGEPGMDMGTRGLSNIDWSPYEEDTAEKYEILKQKLREADYVAYSSKRIYDSVDELPRRYPMTTRYYDAMWDGSLGYELAYEVTSPPRLFGHVFEDRTADESWSLYDHPQVTIFRKVRDLSDAEFDSVLGGTWLDAIPYDIGEPSRWTRPLTWLGLRGGPGSDYKGLFGAVLGLVTGEHDTAGSTDEEPAQLLAEPLVELPVVDNYRWNEWASASPVAAAVVWWLALTLLAWAIWPVCFLLFGRFRDRGYLLSRTAGWLFSGWLLWFLASFGVLQNTVRNAWLVAGAMAIVGAVVAYRNRHVMASFLGTSWPILVAGEILSILAFAVFILVRLANPDLWQPWYGGEKFMEFAFLNGILRSPTFPPVDPHFAGGFINYYYFGIYLAAYLIKLTGIHAEVGFNLTIAMLFALTVSNSFSIAYTAFKYAKKRVTSAQSSWRTGFVASLVAPLFIAVIGNLDGFAQLARSLSTVGAGQSASVPTLFSWAPDALSGLAITLAGKAPFPSYDFWGPSRVIPFTINEFPYWSFLFADLHPHVIGIPLALFFCALLLSVLSSASTGWRNLLARLIALGFLLGALSSVNLWELPTYLALGVVGLAVHRFRRQGSAGLLHVAGQSTLFVGVAAVTFYPFFRSYTNVGASGIGLVREPDSLGTWLLIWGLFLFVAVSWIVYDMVRRPGSCRGDVQYCTPTGVERAYSLAARQYDRLPRMIYLHRMLVRGPTFGYLAGLAILPAGIIAAAILFLTDRAVLGLCVLLLAPAWLLLWKRGTNSDPAALLIAVLTFASVAILAGTQLVYLRDFLQGGDWYRMNTLFKFFMQVWLLLGLATSLAVPRLWLWIFHRARDEEGAPEERTPARAWPRRMLAIGWGSALVVLVVAGLTFTALGTPARLSQRMVGWRPPFGTLDGLEYMRQGTYTLPDEAGQVNLQYDWEAIHWLLDHVRGNPVIVESSQVDYYRSGGTRVASMTGISGLRGFHESEQRSGMAVSEREQLHREFWDTSDVARTEEIIDQLGVELIYVGQLERILHPGGATKLGNMASDGLLQIMFENDGVIIYAVPDSLVVGDDGILIPSRAEQDGSS